MQPAHSETTGRRSRSGGRSARILRRSQTDAPAAPAFITRKIPVYNLLGEEALARLEQQAEWILAEIGIEIRGDEESLVLLREAGASVDGERVRFEPGLARALCSTAPAEFQVHARDPSRTITIGGDHIVMAPTFGPPMVTDLDRGRRKGSIEDFLNFVRLGQATPYLHHSGGSICEPEDLPLNKRHLDMVYGLIRYSTKSFMGASSAPERGKDSIHMAELVFGRDFMADRCVMLAGLNINSPLAFDHITTGVMKAYARAGQGVLLSPFMMSGAMSPVTQPAAIAQVHAECMAGIALYQLYRKGSPIIYGSFLTTMDLKTGAPTYGTPEANLSTFATAQLARRLGVPVRCGGHYTASKMADGQAVQESIEAMNAGLMAGANFLIHAAGWLDGGMTTSYEKYVMDLDHCGMIHRMMDGLTLDDNQLGTEAYRQAAAGENFLGVDHTQRNFEAANFRSDIADSDPYEHWVQKGSEDIQQRANRRWKEMLEQYEEPPIDPAVDEALRDFIERRKRSGPDAWY